MVNNLKSISLKSLNQSAFLYLLSYITKRRLMQVADFIKLISPVSEAALDQMSGLFTRRKLKKGDNFIEAGVVARKIAFLEEGYLRAYYATPDGVTYNKHFFKAPTFIGGYSSLVSGQINQIIQQALTDCIIWQADYKRFTALYDQYPDLERVARILAESFFVQKEKREVEIVLLDADKRYEIFQQEFPELEQLIPQYHIASYLGITPTQLSRIRKKMSEKSTS